MKTEGVMESPVLTPAERREQQALEQLRAMARSGDLAVLADRYRDLERNHVDYARDQALTAWATVVLYKGEVERLRVGLDNALEQVRALTADIEKMQQPILATHVFGAGPPEISS